MKKQKVKRRIWLNRKNKRTIKNGSTTFSVPGSRCFERVKALLRFINGLCTLRSVEVEAIDKKRQLKTSSERRDGSKEQVTKIGRAKVQEHII